MKQEVYNYPIVKDNTVRFLYNNTEAKSVKVLGSFTNWKPDIVLKKKNDIYWESKELKLHNNKTYEYKFLLDDSTYLIDPMNFYKKDGKYGQNSLLFIWENPEGFKEFLDNTNQQLLKYLPQSGHFQKREQIIKSLDKYLNILAISRSVLLNQFFEKRIQNTIKEIKTTIVKDGIRIWSLYNAGFIIKTPTAVFGLDVVSTNCIWGLDWDISKKILNQLAVCMDFLLVTHQHSDHSDKEIIDLLLKKKKKVVVISELKEMYDKRVTFVDYNSNIRIKNQKIFVFKGEHVYDNGRNLKVCYYQIFTDTGINIVHTGDHDYTKFFRWKSNIDCLIAKMSGVHPDYSVRNCFHKVKEFKPKILIPGHIVELAHPPGGGRGTYSEILHNVINIDIPVAVLMWGESYHLIL